MTINLKTEFPDRESLVRYVAELFPEAAARDDHVSPTQGGRSAALQKLQAIDPVSYAKTRNHLDGRVSQLSPYIRHGVLSLSEVRDHALRLVTHQGEAEKFVNELAWRDYWQRVYDALGEGVWQDREPWKTGHRATDYARELPEDLQRGETGLACMDAFARQLAETGYLHNHARMWVAAYVVHFLRVRWQAGAAWFLQHLLDGDPASNNLSWQWVASTFSHKPYIFNRANLEKYTGGRFCQECPLRRRCPFEGSYEQLNLQLFGSETAGNGTAGGRIRPETTDLPTDDALTQTPVVWVHPDGLNPDARVFRQHSHAPAIFVWDDAALEKDRWTLKRLVFLYECLLELPVIIRRGRPVDEIRAFAQQHGTSQVVTTPSPNPLWKQQQADLGNQLTVTVCADEPLIDSDQPFPLERFSRYWRQAKRYAFG